MLRLLVVAFTLGVLSAAPDTVQILEEPPPEEVSDQIRPALSNRLYKVELKGNSTAEFWFRDEMPVREGSQGDLGVNFGLFKRGALLGIVRFSSQWKDYKQSAVKAGVYALRYAAQPRGWRSHRKIALPRLSASGSRRPGPGTGRGVHATATGSHEPRSFHLNPPRSHGNVSRVGRARK